MKPLPSSEANQMKNMREIGTEKNKNNDQSQSKFDPEPPFGGGGGHPLDHPPWIRACIIYGFKNRYFRLF